ncbi:MAG: hypothetical protein FK734_20700 [Asgard group archaeon]|nr:hypothetical protein [Asgard group archaeon]
MSTCKNCGSSIDDNLDNCPFCGQVMIKEDFKEISETFTEEISDESLIQQDNQLTKTSQDEDEILYAPEIEEMIDGDGKPHLEQLEIVPERKYYIWLLLGIISLGIVLLIYLFINIEDLERHSYYPIEPRGEPINISASQSLMIFLIAICFGFIPILWWIYYKKYASLYYHLRNQKADSAPFKVPHPLIYLIPLVLSHLIALIPTIVWFATGNDVRATAPAVFWSVIGLVLLFTFITFALDYLWQRSFNFHIRYANNALATATTQEE